MAATAAEITASYLTVFLVAPILAAQATFLSSFLKAPILIPRLAISAVADVFSSRHSPDRFLLFLATMIFFILFAALFVAMSQWIPERQKPYGLCPTCGYDLRASKEICPECGSPIEIKSECQPDYLLSTDYCLLLPPFVIRP